jgi:hypothetical protein
LYEDLEEDGRKLLLSILTTRILMVWAKWTIEESFPVPALVLGIWFLLPESRRYWKLKEEAQDRTLWRTQFGRGYGPVARQTTTWTRIS